MCKGICMHTGMDMCVCEHIQVWVSVRVHTCTHAQAESYCGWERGNVGSAGGLLQGRSYTQITRKQPPSQQ